MPDARRPDLRPLARGEAAAWHRHGHRDVSGGWLRPAVFGVMDGLVSNVALLSGFAGGSASRSTVVLAGLAGLASGAFSMATGEYTSVRSQNEATTAEIEVERRALSEFPAAELRELAAMYARKGVDPALAAALARQLHVNPEIALAVHSQEELGVTPGRLPSAPLAAGASFVAFALGALIPVLPYLFGAENFLVSAVLAGVALFAVGVLVSRFTGRSPLLSGARQLALGALSAGATYLVGVLVGGVAG
ncbi:VIT1/CCC1 transporter family protein [Frankia sp. CNm7]|uniref:VIT1/CCC1 transporter family protein n=1 Tax=Frankia nepalensis TaxID=1836974 RepID=A0A937RU63_9ACTN|nr:VIT1/CCC1 transporter family protein [Frankia nepalensis]MBL7500575.1 VIT1/CCC1 transporter family protein [Frankia nepalensis]MBL7509562.1 VIT1/CCC1 transporter family protein [Frankia nepalensis]MBL7524388.1 VIT1/CCC1 transporter family protein [Frankia nepalensis]MBL7633399.1 VIT1/CCC1 transporter family protein [Frankia nepalensis]